MALTGDFVKSIIDISKEQGKSVTNGDAELAALAQKGFSAFNGATGGIAAPLIGPTTEALSGAMTKFVAEAPDRTLAASQAGITALKDVPGIGDYSSQISGGLISLATSSTSEVAKDFKSDAGVSSPSGFMQQMAGDFRIPNPSTGKFDIDQQSQTTSGTGSDPSLEVTKSTTSPSSSASTDSTEERLFKIVPRSGANLFTKENIGKPQHPSYSDRGPIASLRLIKNPNVADDKRQGMNDKKFAQDFKTITSDDGYKNFFLTDVSASFNEKMQVIPTFGDNEVVYYFGRNPVMFTLSGMLFDSLDQDWFTRFYTLYQSSLRGTQLARNFELVKLRLPNLMVTGTIAQFDPTYNSNNDVIVGFTLQILAKFIEPIPIQSLSGPMNYNVLNGSFLNFNVGKGGAGSSSWGMILKVKGFSESIGAVGSQMNDLLKPIGKGLYSLNSLSSSVFAPVYGILSSITKVVKSVTGSTTSLISSFTNPVNAILRDIQNVSSQAMALANLVESSVNQIVSIPGRMIGNIQATIQSLRNTAGVISRLPETISQSLQRLTSMGRLSGKSNILFGNPTRAKSKTPMLGSGRPYTPKSSYRLSFRR